MTHIDQDQLLRYVLELHDDHEVSRLQDHLSKCPECRDRWGKLETETKLIKELEPIVEQTIPPLPTRSSPPVSVIPKIAFALGIGFLTGFGVSEYRASGNITVVEQHLIPNSTPITTSQNFSCQGMEISFGFELDLSP